MCDIIAIKLLSQFETVRVFVTEWVLFRSYHVRSFIYRPVYGVSVSDSIFAPFTKQFIFLMAETFHVVDSIDAILYNNNKIMPILLIVYE